MEAGARRGRVNPDNLALFTMMQRGLRERTRL